MRAPRTPFSDVDLGSKIGSLLRSRGVDQVAIYAGTRPGRVFLDFTTNSEAAVFRALRAGAETLMQLEQSGVNGVSAFELLMTTDRRQRAGQFLIDSERAQELTTRQLDESGFFLKYVQF